MHILRKGFNRLGEEVYTVGHYIPVRVLQEWNGSRSVGGEFEVLHELPDADEAAAMVNYLNGGLGAKGPDIDYIIASFIELLKRGGH